jgi:hypothetical protein
MDELATMVERIRGLDWFSAGWRAEQEGLREITKEPGLRVYEDGAHREWLVFDDDGLVKLSR